MAPVQRVEGADDGALVLIDATSGAGGLPVDVTEADVYYFGPQKCFASDGGLWLAAFSPAALERVDEIAASGRWVPDFFSLPTAISNSRLEPDLQHAGGRHPGAARRARSTGSTSRAAWTGPSQRTTDSSGRLYAWAERTAYTTPFVADPPPARWSSGTIDFDDAIDAAAVAKALARQRDRRRGALSQARPQPAARRDVPRRRAGRRVGADDLHRLRRRPARLTPQRRTSAAMTTRATSSTSAAMVSRCRNRTFTGRLRAPGCRAARWSP